MVHDESLYNLLDDAHEILSSLNILWWLDCGTLLGVYRENNLLSWESDIDIGAWKEELKPKIIIKIVEYFRSRDYAVNIYENFICIKRGCYVVDIKLYQHVGGNAVEYKYQFKNRFMRIIRFVSVALTTPYNIDVSDSKSTSRRVLKELLLNASKILPNAIKPKLGKRLSAFYQKHGLIDVTEAVPVEYFLTLKHIFFRNKYFPIPDKVEEYIVFRYGVTWETPDKNWITSRDDGGFKLARNELIAK